MVVYCVVRDLAGKFRYWSMIKPVNKEYHFSGARSRIRKAMQREAKKCGQKIIDFREL